MARYITDDCISCGSCVQWCLMEAIHKRAAHMEINPDECVDCRVCEDHCPIGAIGNDEKIK